MERERERPAQLRNLPVGGEPPAGDDLDQIRDKLEGILDGADKVLDGLKPVMAEDFLQQSRQRGAQ